MTVSVQTPRTVYLATASQTLFTFTFRVDSSADLAVYMAGVLQTYGTHYTLALNADQTASPGGDVTFLTPRAKGDLVIIERAVPLTQSVSLPSYNPFPAKTVENSSDRLWMVLQQIAADFSRRVVLLAREDMGGRAIPRLAVPFELPAPVNYNLLMWRMLDPGNSIYPPQYDLMNVSLKSLAELLTPYLVARIPLGIGARNIAPTPSADGSTVDFDMYSTPTGAEVVLVFVDRMLQIPGEDFTVSGSIITFSTPPPPGATIRVYF